MIIILLFLPFIFGFVIQFLGLPDIIKYICDLAWLFLLLLIFVQKRNEIYEIKKIRSYVILFLISTFLVYLFNYQSVLYYAWGIRNTFRFYVAFIAFAMFLKKYDIDDFLSLIDKAFWINAAICLVQYFVFGINQDYLGGIFGVEVGSNGYMNNFFVIVASKSVISYLNKTETLRQSLPKLAMILFISALAELKFFYVEFLVIVALAIVMTDFSWRKLSVAIFTVVGSIMAIYLLISLFPEFSDSFTLEAMYESAVSLSGYTGKGELNRLTTLPVISEIFLDTPAKRLFGLGLGNCDTASFSFLNTPFYEKYGWLRYNWFSTSFVFLEMGYIGLFFYFAFFVIIYFMIKKIEKRNKAIKSYCQISSIIAVCCVLVSIYNVALRTEAGYMMYFMLAIPFALDRNTNKSTKNNFKQESPL